jgi:hypothetical protein
LTLQGTTSSTRTTSYVLLQPTAGNVGIGLTAPTTKLQVGGTLGTSVIASISGNLIVMPNGGWGGNVGIGTTTPFNTLDVSGAAGDIDICANAGCLTGHTTTNYPVIKTTGTNLYFDVNGVYAGYVSTAGFNNVSDRALKENFVDLNPQDILAEIDQLPTLEWNYIAQGPSIKHIGPIAQDFAQIFALGGDNTTITTVDPAGIALVGIRALSDDLNTQQAKITSLSANLTPFALTNTGNLNLVDQNAANSNYTIPHYFTLNDAL